MAALPYIQLYVADYLADTMHLSVDQHGAYLLLIMNYWQTGKPIPKDRLARIVRVTNERWQEIEPALAEFFEDDGKRWIHLRIEKDLEAIHTQPRGKKLPANDSLKGYKGYVYFVTSPSVEMVKVGYSKNPWARLNELRRSYGDDLTVAATIKTVEKSEVSVHKLLDDFRIENEWFQKSECIKGIISAVNDGEITTVADIDNYVADYGSATTTTTNTDTDTDTENKDIAGSDDPAPDQTGDLLGDTSTPPTKKPRKPKSAYQLTRLGNGQYLYPDDFNRVWAKYPQRPAGDDKREAFEAFNARVTEGASLQEIEDGVDRYLAYVKANGNLGTDFVKRGKTFFGPSRWFEKPWTITATATPGQQNPRANPGREDRDAEIDRLLAEQGQGVGVTYEHE